MSTTSSGVTVTLRAAKIPAIGLIASHYWLVVERGGARDRWEVWQRPDVGGESWGHLHRNLKAHDEGVGNGPSWTVCRWTGEAAAALADRLQRSPRRYPWCHKYRLWPGPNSNTFAQWILGDAFRLDWRGWGRSYARHADPDVRSA